MKSHLTYKVTFCLLALTVFTCNYAAAQITTVIPAEITAGNVDPSTTTTTGLTFNLNTLPANCKITACQLQLTCEKDVTDAPQLILLSANNNQIDNYALKPSKTGRGSVITLTVGKAWLPRPGDIGYVLKLKLDHAIKKTANFFKSTGVYQTNQSYAPRLIVSYTYESEDKQAAITDWASVYGNYQHLSQLPVSIKGAIPTLFKKTEIGGFKDLPQNMVMYRDHIYTVTDADVVSVDLTTLKTGVVSPALGGSKYNSAPVIDPFGRLYHAALDQFAVTDLATGQYSGGKPAAGNISTALTIGPDGSLYVPCDNSISAYTPYPKNALMWDIYPAGKKSPVALNRAGTIAYVFIQNQASVKLYSYNTATGFQLGSIDIDLNGATSEDYLPSPVVDDNGYVYLTNKIRAADRLYILNPGLTGVVRKIENTVSMPAGYIDDHLKVTGMYFINQNTLYKYDSGLGALTAVLKIPGDDGQQVRSLVTDQSNGIYYTITGKSAFYYKPANADAFTSFDLGVNFEKNLLIGADVTFYTATGNNIIAIKSASYSGDYELVTGDQNRNNNSFIGNDITIHDDFSFSNYKYIKAINGITFLGKATLTKNAEVLIKVGKVGNGVRFNNDFTVAKGAVLQVKTGN